MHMIVRALLIASACVLALACSNPDQQHRAAANEYLSSRNDISTEFRTAIENSQVLIGMSPEEASIAGGANIFDIDRDRTVWPKEETDPWRILAAQRLHPDDSKIKLHFENKTQFGTSEKVRFTAIFVRGRVASIERGWHLGP